MFVPEDYNERVDYFFRQLPQFPFKGVSGAMELHTELQIKARNLVVQAQMNIEDSAKSSRLMEEAMMLKHVTTAMKLCYDGTRNDFNSSVSVAFNAVMSFYNPKRRGTACREIMEDAEAVPMLATKG